MILRRLSTAVREQDWFTVLVETLIVVFGVFIGLQVNNWNAARQIHARQDAVLSQLANELDLSVEEADQRIAYQQRILEQIDIVIVTVDAGQLDPDNEVQFNAGLGQLDGWWQPAWRLATVDELVSQGQLGLIPDPALRFGLVAYRDTVDVIRSDIVMLISDISVNLPFINRHLRSTPITFKSVTGTEEETANATLFDFRADLTSLSADPQAVGSLDNIRRDQTYALLNQITIRDEAVRLRDQLHAVTP